LAARHPDWVVGYADEVWWSRLAQPALHAWGETLRLKAKARAKDDPQPKALACYGLLRTDQDRVLLRFVEGRPVSRVTTDFLAWGADRLAAEDKRVWVLVWDNAAWHVSRAVQAWICRPPIEKSPVSPFQMSLSSLDGCWERVTDDGDCDEPQRDRPHACPQGHDGWPDYGE